MSNNSPKLAKNTIKNIAYEVRNNYPQIVDKCFKISGGIQKIFDRRYGIQLNVRELQVGEDRATHFVNTVPMSLYSNGNDQDKLLIDVSLQQFSLENKNQGCVTVGLDRLNNLPEKGVYINQVVKKE